VLFQFYFILFFSFILIKLKQNCFVSVLFQFYFRCNHFFSQTHYVQWCKDTRRVTVSFGVNQQQRCSLTATNINLINTEKHSIVNENYEITNSNSVHYIVDEQVISKVVKQFKKRQIWQQMKRISLFVKKICGGSKKIELLQIQD